MRRIFEHNIGVTPFRDDAITVRIDRYASKVGNSASTIGGGNKMAARICHLSNSNSIRLRCGGMRCRGLPVRILKVAVDDVPVTVFSVDLAQTLSYIYMYICLRTCTALCHNQ